MRVSRPLVGTSFILVAVVASITTVIIDHKLSAMRLDALNYGQMVNFGHQDMSIIVHDKFIKRNRYDTYIVYGISGLIGMFGGWLIVSRSRAGSNSVLGSEK